MSIRCTKYKAINKGNLQGVANIFFPINQEGTLGIVIRDCQLFMKNGFRWINFPSKPFEKDDGTRGYYSYLYFEGTKETVNARAMKEHFDKKAIAAIEKYCAETPPSVEEQQYEKQEVSNEELPF